MCVGGGECVGVSLCAYVCVCVCVGGVWVYLCGCAPTLRAKPCSSLPIRLAAAVFNAFLK